MAKKSFKAEVAKNFMNPAEAFITAAEIPQGEAAEPAPKRETKSVRVNLLFRPTTKRNIEKLAFVNKTSINDFIHIVLEEYIAAHSKDLDKYNQFFTEE